MGIRLSRCVAFPAILLMLAGASTATAQQGADRDTAQPAEPTREVVLRTASALIDAGELDKAESALKPLLNHNTNDAEVLILLGRIRADQHRFDDAMAAFESVLKVRPENPAARASEVKAGITAALEAKRTGDNDGAMVYLARARKYVPDDPELLLDFAVHAGTMHLYKDAEGALAKSLELRPDDPRTIYALGHLELNEQQMPQAEAHLRQYVKLRPQDASAHYGLGKLLHILARDDEAEVELQRSIELQPQQTESYYELGDIELRRHQDDAAAVLFEKILRRNAKHGGALTGIGIVAYRKKDYAKAESFLQSAVVYAADYSTAHFYYGVVLMKLGRAAEGEKELALAKDVQQKEKQEQGGNVLSTTEPPR